MLYFCLFRLRFSRCGDIVLTAKVTKTNTYKNLVTARSTIYPPQHIRSSSRLVRLLVFCGFFTLRDTPLRDLTVVAAQ